MPDQFTQMHRLVFQARYDLSVRDRGAIFGLRGPNAELPIGGGKLAGATTIGINKLPLQKNVFNRFQTFLNIFSHH